MNRDHYVVGLPPDWSHRSHTFTPLTQRAEPRRRMPQAPHRMVPQWRVEQIKARWFALGSLATGLPLVAVIVATHVWGG